VPTVRHGELGGEDRHEDTAGPSTCRNILDQSGRDHPGAVRSAMGGKDQEAGGCDPNDPTISMLPTKKWCMSLNTTGAFRTPRKVRLVFANVYMYPENRASTASSEFNVVRQRTEWEIRIPTNWGRALVKKKTGGGLAYIAALGGDFRAGDRETGKVVW